MIDSSLAVMAPVKATTTWVLSNHDVQRHVTRYGGGELGERRARAAALLMLALPGSAYVYQGEELGLPEVLDLPEDLLQDPTWERSGHTERGRDGCRVPVPWTTDGSALGFGPDGSTPWLPQPADWSGLSVQAQQGDTSSMLELYRVALHTRRGHPALGGSAEMAWREAPAGLLHFDRTDTATGRTLACVVNAGDPSCAPAGRGDRAGLRPGRARRRVRGGARRHDRVAGPLTWPRRRVPARRPG